MWQETISSSNRHLLNTYHVSGTSQSTGEDAARTKYILACSFQERILPWQRALQNLLERKWLTSVGISVGPATGNCQQISHGVF